MLSIRDSRCGDFFEGSFEQHTTQTIANINNDIDLSNGGTVDIGKHICGFAYALCAEAIAEKVKIYTRKEKVFCRFGICQKGLVNSPFRSRVAYMHWVSCCES